jgi:RimJ/RimL family protein N-acetyltransferase
MQVFLETDRLVLRQLTEADVDNLYDLDSDPPSCASSMAARRRPAM